MFILLCFVVQHAPSTSNSLFGSMREMDGNIRFQFQGQALLFSEGSTLERNTFILGGDERTLCIIFSTAVLEGKNWTVYQKPEFISMYATPNTDKQLLVREGQ